MWRRGWWSSQLRRVHTIDPAAACYQLPNTPAAAAVTLLHPPSLSLLPLQGLAGRWWAPFSWCPPLVTSPPRQSSYSPPSSCQLSPYPLLYPSHPSDKSYPLPYHMFSFFRLQCWRGKTKHCSVCTEEERDCHCGPELGKTIVTRTILLLYSHLITFYLFRIILESKMGNEGSLPVDGVAFDAEEIKRLGKRFKKLVNY